MRVNSRAELRNPANPGFSTWFLAHSGASRPRTIGGKLALGKLRLCNPCVSELVEIGRRGGHWPLLRVSKAEFTGLHHVHAAHAAAWHVRMLFLLLRRLGHARLGGDEQTC